MMNGSKPVSDTTATTHEPHWVYQQTIAWTHSPITFALKANIAVKGKITNAGSALLANYRPNYDSDVFTCLASRYAYRGAVVCDTFAVGVGQNNPLPILNPPVGGSSTGCGWALLRNEVSFAIGSSTGGSCTEPAIQCGLYSFQGARGAISRYGLIPYHQSLDRLAVMGKDLDVIQQVSRLLMAYDSGRDQLKRVVPSVSHSLDKAYLYLPGDTGLLEKLESALRERGITCLRVTPIKEPLIQYYQKVTTHYLMSNLNRYDGVRFNPSPFDYCDNAKRSANRAVGLSKAIIDRFTSMPANYPLEIPELFSQRLPLNEAYHFILHRIANTQEELLEGDFEKCIPNVHNLASLTIPFTGEYGLQILAPSGYENTLWSLARGLQT